MSEKTKKSRRELAANLVASFATGVTIISLTNPVDTLKCRWQVLPKGHGRSLTGTVGGILLQEGLFTGLWRPGLGPNMVAMGCAIGCRNGFYPLIRDTLGSVQDLLGPQGASTGKVGPTGMFASGLLAGMCGYFLASPLLQVKTQMQAEAGLLGPDGKYETGARTGQPPTYRNAVQALRTLAASGATEGRGALGAVQVLWRGAGVIVGRGAALSASQLCAYDATKTELKARGLLGDGPLLHVTASVAAAIACTTCSMPLDVVLTVYQSAHSFGGQRLERYGRAGPLACAGVLLRESGPLVFMRGWVPAFARLAPTCVSSFFLYEQLRKLVGIGFLD